ncbi:MAG: hypothetical protein LBI03_10510 [Clostridiales bacterium]|nr:hypothetical protein [Clostridiales bacterium]
MELKQSRAGRIYIRMITKNHFTFPIILFIGVVAILLMLVYVKIDVMQTYTATVGNDNTIAVSGQIFTGSDHKKTTYVYLYTDKNTAVYQINGTISQDSSQINDTVFTFSSSNAALDDFLKSNEGEQINADIAVRQISLLQRIFSR